MARKLSNNEMKLRDGISIIDYYNQFIVPTSNKFYKLSVGKKAGLCPFHDDTDPSFHFWEETKMFHCFGCQLSGDIITLHQKFEWKYHNRGLDRKTAIKELGTLYNIPITDEDDNIDEEGLNPFQRAKKYLSDSSTVECNKNAFSLAKFRNLNNMVRSFNIKSNQKVASYCELDVQASAFLLRNKNS